jgi:exodeoxyribonuclease V alpha subunit
MDRLRCVVERITYQNEKNGYSVIKCRVKGYNDLVPVVGAMPEVHVGAVLTLTGEWKMDAKYGRQFSIFSYEETLPATVYGIEKYLGSGLVKGIGPKFAGRIVRQFGADTLNVIETEPDRLLEVPGIGAVRVERIKKSWIEQKEIKNIMLFLQGHDVSTSHATKIYKTYGNESIQVVQENPYRLADDIWGIGFKTADTIASKMGFGHDKYPRLRSGLLYTLNTLADEGHCYAIRNQLLKACAELLDIDISLLSPALDEMINANDVITDDEAIYLPPFYYSEVGTAKRLKTIYNSPSTTTVDTNGLVERIASATGMNYDEVQMQAIETAARSKVLILTGGPGTGKTTIVNGMLSLFGQMGLKCLLAAPTGRAAKRLTEVTGQDASTIHRLLEAGIDQNTGLMFFAKDENNPLKADVIIVDEMSMVDIQLLHSLLQAIPRGKRLILVGDPDQLPPVGPGYPFSDCLRSQVLPTVRLTDIFRQAQESLIVMNAHRINRGEMPDLRSRKSDFFFLPCRSEQEVAQTIVDLCARRLPTNMGIPADQIQVLSPTRKGGVGTGSLNQMLQGKLNPPAPTKKERQFGDFIFREGDRVMQIRNNYDIMWKKSDGTMAGTGIFNGDIGIIKSIDMNMEQLTILFDDDRVADYDFTQLNEIEPAYAMTVHKSQGSEYRAVVLSAWSGSPYLLNRSVLYTAVTRAKSLLIIVGREETVAAMAANAKVGRRYSGLKLRLQGKSQ